MNITTQTVHGLLAKRYASPEFALMFEVAPRTGGGTRYADAVAVGLWQSRGHTVHGIEVKVSRSDWLRELKHPAKAEESVFAFCDFWWIVAPADCIKEGELPPTWGWLEVRANGLVQKVAAPKLDPKPITRAFFASLMRRGTEGINGIAERMQRQQVDAAKAEIDQRVAAGIAQRTRLHDRLLDRVMQFEESTGLRFDDFMAPPAEVIKLAQRLHTFNGHKGEPLGKLADLAEQLKSSGDRLQQVIEASGLRVAPKESDACA